MIVTATFGRVCRALHALPCSQLIRSRRLRVRGALWGRLLGWRGTLRVRDRRLPRRLDSLNRCRCGSTAQSLSLSQRTQSLTASCWCVTYAETSAVPLQHTSDLDQRVTTRQMRRITVYILAAAVKYSHRCSDMGIACTRSPACLTARPTLPASWTVEGDVWDAKGVTFVHRHSLGLMGGRICRPDSRPGTRQRGAL